MIYDATRSGNGVPDRFVQERSLVDAAATAMHQLSSGGRIDEDRSDSQTLVVVLTGMGVADVTLFQGEVEEIAHLRAMARALTETGGGTDCSWKAVVRGLTLEWDDRLADLDYWDFVALVEMAFGDGVRNFGEILD